MLLENMIVNREFNRKFKKDYFFIQGILEIDCKYFIEKIKESCVSENNNNYTTNIKGLMTPFEFFKKDEKFLKQVSLPLINYIDENYDLRNYHLFNAWGFELKPGGKTTFHDHHTSLWSGVVYLNDCKQPLEFPEIKQECKPQKGAFCVFNSFLLHGCRKNQDNISKFGMSFNFNETTNNSWL